MTAISTKGTTAAIHLTADIPLTQICLGVLSTVGTAEDMPLGTIPTRWPRNPGEGGNAVDAFAGMPILLFPGCTQLRALSR